VIDPHKQQNSKKKCFATLSQFMNTITARYKNYNGTGLSRIYCKKLKLLVRQ